MSLKTKSMGVLISLSCCFAFAADDAKVQQSLNEVTVAKDQTRQLMSTSMTNEQKERVRYISDRLISAESLLQQALGGNPAPIPPAPPAPPTQGGSIDLYHSDNCSGSLIGSANAATRCDKFSSAPTAWAVRINGQCLDIPDVAATNACESFKAAGDSSAPVLYHSDNCSSSPIAAVGSISECGNLEATGSAAWAIKIQDKCYDVQDMAPAKACESFKAASSPYAVQIYHSDNCSGTLLAAVDGNTRCENLKGLPTAWAVMSNGRCEDISDTDIVAACERFRP